MVGLADDDPLLAVGPRAGRTSRTAATCYAFSWSDDPGRDLDGRVPYVEIATL